jgi:osmoprotectant transport system substrate-binding protein
MCKKMIRAMVLTVAVFAFIACGNVGEGADEGPADNGEVAGNGDGPTITVGSKNFTEQYILGNMYAQALAANGFNAQTELDLGSEQIADQALQSGQIDLYPEYTGTALVGILDYGEENLAQLETAEETYEAARELYAERDPANTMLQPAPFDNNYGIFVRADVAEEQDLQTLEDLAEASPKLTFVSFSEFQNRSDGYPNMQENYGFDFGNIEIVNSLGLRYQGVLQGEGEVGVGFTTDGQLTSDELVVMEDEQGIWPVYQPAPVVRTEVLEENPEIEEILNEVSASLDVETMRELNGQVDIEQRNPEDVAEEFLREQGIVE